MSSGLWFATCLDQSFYRDPKTISNVAKYSNYKWSITSEIQYWNSECKSKVGGSVEDGLGLSVLQLWMRFIQREFRVWTIPFIMISFICVMTMMSWWLESVWQRKHDWSDCEPAISGVCERLWILFYWTEEIKKIFNKVRPESVIVFIEQIKKKKYIGFSSLLLLYLKFWTHSFFKWYFDVSAVYFDRIKTG